MSRHASSRHLADAGRHLADEPGLPGTILIGTVNAAFVGIFSAGQHTELAGRVVTRPVDGTTIDDLVAHLPELLAAEDAPIAGIVSFLPADERTQPDRRAVTVGMALTAALARALDRLGATVPLWSVTRAADSVGTDDQPVSPDQAAWWGLHDAITTANPTLRAGIIDMAGTAPPSAAATLADLLARRGDPDLLAVRGADVFARRLVHDPVTAVDDPEWTDGTVLVTVGTEGLGADVARWLADRGVRNLVLTGPSTQETAALTAELTARGGDVVVVDRELTDRDAVAAVLAAVPDEYPLRGIVHTAAMPGDEPLGAEADPLDMAAIDRALANVAGTAILDELTRQADLAAFVVCCSATVAAGVLGGSVDRRHAPGQAFLAAVAHRRRALGWPAAAVLWGPWRTDAEQGDGPPPVPARLAVAAVTRAFAPADQPLLLADVDWTALPQDPGHAANPLLQDLLEAASPGDHPDQESGPELRRRIAEAPESVAQRLLVGLLRTHAAIVLGHDSTESIDADDHFLELGFSSFTALELSNRLKTEAGLDVHPAAIYDHPTPTTLARHLRAELTAACDQRFTSRSPGPCRRSAGRAAAGPRRAVRPG